MLKTLDRYLRRTPQLTIIGISLLLVAAVATIDNATGSELSFSIFYLLPVSLAAWYAGGRIGRTISIVAAGAWLAIDATSGAVYSSPLIPFWNAAVRFGFFLLVAQLITSLQRHVKQEENLARVDGLTGVMSGRTFRHSAAEVVGLAGRNGKPFTIAYVDLDDFKKVNDTRGHAEGDRALKAVGSALMNSIRRTDIVGRLGGDEFAVLLPETDESGAREVVAKIRAGLASATESGGWPIGASIGATVFLTPPDDPEKAIAQADELMYRAKASGKNRTVFIEVGAASSSPALLRERPTKSPGGGGPDTPRD